MPEGSILSYFCHLKETIERDDDDAQKWNVANGTRGIDCLVREYFFFFWNFYRDCFADELFRFKLSFFFVKVLKFDYFIWLDAFLILLIKICH